MLVVAGAFQQAPSVDTIPLSRSQVCIRKLSSSCNFKVCLCRVIDPFARFTYRAPSRSRAEVLTHRCQVQSTSSSQKFQSERSFHKGTRRHDLQSLKEAVTQQNSLDDALHSYDESPSQDLQRLKGFLNQHSEAQPKRDGGLEQQRLPKAATGVSNYSKTESVHRTRNQLGTQSSATSSGSSQPGGTFKNRDARASKHRGRRIPPRGLDVLDKLMASQSHTSRALLESLQSTLASEDDGMPNARFHGEHTPKVHSKDNASTFFSGKVSRNETAVSAEKVRGSIETWRPKYDTTTDNAATSSTFASSIEKVLSPSTASCTTRSALASSTNARVLEQNLTSSSNKAQLAGDSDVAKPSLRGQEVLLALQQAAMEKAKLKQRTRKVPDRTSASKFKQVASQYESGEWRDAKPIIVKPEWVQQIDELERRIENLKNPMPSL